MSGAAVRVCDVDAPLALYRRYRPDTFAQVIGQDHVTEPLRAALRNNRVNHAYLFSGPRGCGKTTSARILARALNCAEGPVEEPCGKCDSCRELATGGPGSVDVIEIDAASHGGVDDARDLREQATFQPMRDRYKIYIIDEAHMVSPQGFNALLKIVEEPPEHVRFIFATTEPEKVIGTIRSRTHHYPFLLIPPRVLSAYLAELCDREQVPIEPAALPLVVRAGGGSARDTLSVLDQLIGGAGGDGVTYALTTALLGFTPDSLLDEIVDAFAAHDGAAVFGVVDKVIEVGQDPRRFTGDLLQRLRDLVIVSVVPDAPATGLIDVPEDQAERLVAQAARFGRHDLARAAELVAEGLAELKGTSAPRLLLELLCARILLPGADDSADGLAARIDRLEKRMSMAPAAAPAPAPPPRAEAPAPPVDEARRPGPPAESAASFGGREPRQEPQQVPTSAPAQSRAPEHPAAPEPSRPATSQPPPSAQPGVLTLVDIRHLWPEVVEAVKGKRRVTWIQLSQHAQLVGLDGRTLTVGFNNPGARESFVNGRSDVILQQVLIDLVGQEFTIDAIVDPSARPGTEPPLTVTRPAVSDAPPPRERQPSPETTRSAREAIQPTRAGGRPTRPEEEPVDSAAHRDDPDAEDVLDGAELLSQRLGAQVIEEIKHD
ncbi:MAG TPA: DNA polymerase III subunit gamma and tau [Marmoricola sp.]|nr:DNA polymerase III subunit gamma and tau [Marmoricola sp.]